MFNTNEVKEALAIIDKETPHCSLDFQYNNGLVAVLSWHKEVLEVMMGFQAEIEPEAVERWNNNRHKSGFSPLEQRNGFLLLRKEIENPRQPLPLEDRFKAVVQFEAEGLTVMAYLALLDDKNKRNKVPKHLKHLN